MSIEWGDREDWAHHTGFVQDLVHIQRVKFVLSELRDFGRDIEIAVEDETGMRLVFAMTRVEGQKLFDDMWKYWFRPTDAKQL